MGPAVVLRGDPRANEFYELCLDELKTKVAEGDGERYITKQQRLDAGGSPA